MKSQTQAALQEPSLTIVLVSNGPGELATWVRPLAERLHKKLLIRPRIRNSVINMRLVLVPCPNSTGLEANAAKKWYQFETITPANKFWELLLNPKKFGFNTSKGLVIFLGGDQFWTVLLSARLGYKHITYAEWVARWPYWNDRIAAMSEEVRDKIPLRFRKRCSVVGDLMADLYKSAQKEHPMPPGKWIALMPGSKHSKLCVGVPFMLEVADIIANKNPEYNFLLPVASTTNVNAIVDFMSSKNEISNQYNSGFKAIVDRNNIQRMKKLITNCGTEIYLEEEQPAHDSLSQCELAITTIGANTAELGALGIPMIVIVPTQHLSVMQAWDGFLGILGRMPCFKWCLGVLLSLWRLRNNGFLAWPNITAKRRIVPEKVGRISPKEIADEALMWMSSPERLQGQKEDLQSLRGKPGAVEAMAKEVMHLLPKAITTGYKSKFEPNSNKNF